MWLKNPFYQGRLINPRGDEFSILNLKKHINISLFYMFKIFIFIALTFSLNLMRAFATDCSKILTSKENDDFIKNKIFSDLNEQRIKLESLYLRYLEQTSGTQTPSLNEKLISIWTDAFPLTLNILPNLNDLKEKSLNFLHFLRKSIANIENTNHTKAIHYVADLIRNKKNLTTENVKNIHRIIFENTMPRGEAGHYRSNLVLLVGVNNGFPKPEHLDPAMKELLRLYQSEEFSNLHPIERASPSSCRFCRHSALCKRKQKSG